MPKIIFDPPTNVNWDKYIQGKNIRNNALLGGALVGDTRSRYMKLCKAITSRDPSLDYTDLRNQILEIMKRDVIEHIHTLPGEDQPSLLVDIETFYTGMDASDNHFNCINIIALQTCILFTKYHHDKQDPEINLSEEFHFQSQEETGQTTYANYNDFIKGRDSERTNNIYNWKIYADLKSQVSSISGDFRFIISSPDPSQPIFMAFIGFLNLRDIMESLLDNVVFCDLSYETDYVDGQIVSPMSALLHDGVSHYRQFAECFNYPTIIKEFRDFQKYVSTTQDKAIQYAINFVIFFLLHESPYCDRTEMRGNSLNTPYFNKITEPFLFRQLSWYNMYALKNINNQGRAIPKEFRVFDPANSNSQLNEDKVKEYLHKVSAIYVLIYKKRQMAKAAAAAYKSLKPTGGGKTRKRVFRSKRLRKTLRRI